MDQAAPSSASLDSLDSSYGLISARVDGTNVYDMDGQKLGSIYSFHIGRRTGQVEYAVLSFGGFLGLGQSYHPVPFAALSFDEERSAYLLTLGKHLLQGGPSYRPDGAPVWDVAYARRISDYYGTAMHRS